MNTLGIEADGAIKGCPSLPTSAYTGGRIRERSLGRDSRGRARAFFQRATGHQAAAAGTSVGFLPHLAIMPSCAAADVRGPRTCFSDGAATTRTATTARWFCDRKGVRERLVLGESRAGTSLRPWDFQHARKSRRPLPGPIATFTVSGRIPISMGKVLQEAAGGAAGFGLNSR